MYSVVGDTTSLVPGFPIRTSSDQRSVDSSPRHNAASHVLHRLPVPRHPPCALKHLQHKTVQKFSEESKNCIIKPNNPHPPPKREHKPSDRCSQPLSTNQTPHPTTKAGRQHVLSPVSHTRDEEIAGLLSQSPIVCLMIHHRKNSHQAESRCGSTFVVHRPDTHYRARH